MCKHTKETCWSCLLSWKLPLYTAISVILFNSICFSCPNSLNVYKNIAVFGDNSQKIASEINAVINAQKIAGYLAMGVDHIDDSEKRTLIYYSTHYPPPNLFADIRDLAIKTDSFSSEIERQMSNPYKFKYESPTCSSLFFVDDRNINYFIIVSDTKEDKSGCRDGIYNWLLSAQ